MTTNYLALSQIADRTGVPINTLKTWSKRPPPDQADWLFDKLEGKLPLPDVSIGDPDGRHWSGWSAATIDKWWERIVQHRKDLAEMSAERDEPKANG